MFRPLTNFDPKDRPFYEAAIAEYGKPELFRIVTSPAVFGRYGHPMNTDFSLHYSGNEDTSPFWRIFEKHKYGKTK